MTREIMKIKIEIILYTFTNLVGTQYKTEHVYKLNTNIIYFIKSYFKFNFYTYVRNSYSVGVW